MPMHGEVDESTSLAALYLNSLKEHEAVDLLSGAPKLVRVCA
jgi:hypothetical protein